MKKRNILTAAGMMALAMVFHSVLLPEASVQAAEKKAKLVFSKSVDSMEQGSSYKFKVKIKNAAMNDVVWKSSNPEVLKIRSNGKVTAKSEGKTVITATVGDVSIKRNVTVYPSLEEISTRNNIAENLNKGVCSSVSCKIEGTDPDLLTMYSKDEKGYIVISSGSSVQVSRGNLTYYYDNKSRLVSIMAAKEVAADNMTAGYSVFSNEKMTSAEEKEDVYKIYTEADIAGMTEKEQKEMIGISDGIIKKELTISKETGLIQEYVYTIQFDKGDPDFKHVSRQKFSYDEEYRKVIPEHVQIVMDEKNTRTVTIISKPGTVEEITTVYTLPVSMPLYIDGTVTYYTDAACTQKSGTTVKNADGTYNSNTLYVK